MVMNKSQIKKWIIAQKRHRLLDVHVQMVQVMETNKLCKV